MPYQSAPSHGVGARPSSALVRVLATAATGGVPALLSSMAHPAVARDAVACAAACAALGRLARASPAAAASLASQGALRCASEALRSCLSDMVITLNEQKLKLLMTIKDLKQQLVQQKTDQADIYFYLNKKCDDSFEVIAALEEQMTAEQTDREISETIFEKKIVDLQASSESMQAKLKARVAELEDKLANMKEFTDHKASMEVQLQNLIETLDMERRKYVQTTEEMENRFILEKNRLQREYALKENRIQGEIASKVGDQLSITTKETQSKNVFLKRELRKQSVEADKVLNISSNIMSKDKQMKIDLDLALANEKELINKLGTYQKVIKQLNEKIETDEKKIEFYKSEMEKKIEEQNEAIDSLKLELKRIGDKKMAEDSQLDEMWIFISSSYADLTREKEAKYGKMRMRQGSVNSLSIGSVSQHHKGNYEGVLIELILTLLEAYPHRFATVIDEYLEANPHFADSRASIQRIDTLKELSQLQIGMDSFYSASQNNSVSSSQIDGTILPDINTGKTRRALGKDDLSYGGGVSWADSSSVPGVIRGSRSIGTQVDMTAGTTPSYSRMPPDLLLLGLGRELEDGGHSIYSAPNNPFGGLGLDGIDGFNSASVENSIKSAAYYGQAKYTLSNSRGRGKSKSNTKIQKSIPANPATQVSEPKVHFSGPGSNQNSSWRPNDELRKENIKLQRYYPALDRERDIGIGGGVGVGGGPKAQQPQSKIITINSPIRTNGKVSNSNLSISDSGSFTSNQIDERVRIHSHSRSKRSPADIDEISVAGQSKVILTGADRVIAIPTSNRLMNGVEGSGGMRSQRNVKRFGGRKHGAGDARGMGGALDDHMQNKSIISEMSLESCDFTIESPRAEAESNDPPNIHEDV